MSVNVIGGSSSSSSSGVSGTAPVGMGAKAGGYSSLGKYTIPGGIKAGSYFLASYGDSNGALKLIYQTADGATVGAVDSVLPTSLGTATSVGVTASSAAVYTNWGISGTRAFWGGITGSVNGYFYGPYGGSQFYYSADGISWSDSSYTNFNDGNGSSIPYTVAYGNGVYMIPAYKSDTQYSSIYKGTTMGSFSQFAVPGTYTPRAIAFGAGIFVIGCMTSTTYFTTDGTAALTTRTGPVAFNQKIVHNGLAAGSGSLFIAYQSGSISTIYTSPDGITWTSRSLGFTNTIISLVYGNGVWLITAGTGMWRSTDGITWTSVYWSPGYWDNTPVVWASWLNKFVAGWTYPGNITVASSDGLTWAPIGFVGENSQKTLVANGSTMLKIDGVGNSAANYRVSATGYGARGTSFSVFTDAYATLN